jgi:biotin carboxylase
LVLENEMRFGKSVCIIVDGYSTGKNLPAYLKGRGYQCIHVKSNPNLPSQYQHNPDDYIKNIIFQGDISAIMTEAKDYKVVMCVAGSESGVELADTLSEHLNLATNGTLYSLARRNKFLMTEFVAKAGLKTVNHIQSGNGEEIIAWSKGQTDWPIVLKPLDSANGDGVLFCHTENEIRSAFDKIISTANVFGQKNEVVLAQAFNPGHEYIINTVSCEGKHFIVEIWKITKVKGSTAYDYAEIIGPEESEFNSLETYTKGVLDALAIRQGASTTELKYTLSGGPVLIETGARLMGNAPLSLSNDLLGFTQLSLMVESYLNPNMFLHLINSRYQPKVNSYAIGVVLISDTEGTLAKKLDTSEIEGLDSFHSYIIDNEPGKQLYKTTSSLNSPGEIYLLNKNRSKLLEDYAKVREIEKHLYREAIANTSIMQDYQVAGLFKIQKEEGMLILPSNSVSTTLVEYQV